MLITKYESIYSSIPKIGCDILLKLQEKPYEPIQLYLELEKIVGINKYWDTLTFLYITDLIYIDMNHLRLVNEIK